MLLNSEKVTCQCTAKTIFIDHQLAKIVGSLLLIGGDIAINLFGCFKKINFPCGTDSSSHFVSLLVWIGLSAAGFYWSSAYSGIIMQRKKE